MQLQDKIFIHYGSDSLIQGVEYGNKPLSKKDIERTMECKYIQSTFNKEFNGLWSSPFTPDKEFSSEWAEFVHSTGVRDTESLKRFFIFKLKELANILVIDSLDNLLDIDSKYAFVEVNSREEELFNKLMDLDVTSPDYFDLLMEYYKCNHVVLLNPQAISKDYDALFITKNAVISLKEAFGLWDVETLLVFNTDVIEVITTSEKGGSLYD